MNNSTPGLLNYINSTTNNTPVCAPMKKGVKVAKNVTCTAADVTCYVGMVLLNMTSKLFYDFFKNIKTNIFLII